MALNKPCTVALIDLLQIYTNIHIFIFVLYLKMFNLNLNHTKSIFQMDRRPDLYKRRYLTFLRLDVYVLLRFIL